MGVRFKLQRTLKTISVLLSESSEVKKHLAVLHKSFGRDHPPSSRSLFGGYQATRQRGGWLAWLGGVLVAFEVTS